MCRFGKAVSSAAAIALRSIGYSSLLISYRQLSNITAQVMLDIHNSSSVLDTKVYFSHSVLPSYIDPQNVSTKKQPFSSFIKQHFSHSLHLVLPEELWESVCVALKGNPALGQPQYARVHMKLSEILEPDFLNSYIKQGNIMMLSEGRSLVDNCFELYEGRLLMELDRPTYERCGLQGIPVEDGGKKHQKQRWLLDINLAAESMKHNKKGFERLEWACKNVLNHSLTWLFYNFNPSSPEALAEGKEAISKHAPWVHNFEPSIARMKDVLVPKLLPRDLPSIYAEDDAIVLLEYLHMLHLDSPRLQKQDSIDPHLSRYVVPAFDRGIGSRNLVQVTWKGFMPPRFAKELFLLVRSHGFKGASKTNDSHDMVDKSGSQNLHAGDDKWFAMSAQAFGGKNGWSVMQFAGRETLVWEIEG